VPSNSSRFAVRARVVSHALALRLVRGPRQRPGEVRRALVAHHLLAGDTLMLTPLLAKLRAVYPAAEIAMTVRPSLAPLYAGRPYGVDVLPFDPRDAAALRELLEASNGYDLAIVPGDNRYSWLAAALDSAWVVAFAGDRPAPKSWMVDELVPFPDTPMAWSDMNTRLVPGAFAEKYDPADWPAPPCAPFERPAGRYAVLHVEASTALRRWDDDKWLALALHLAQKGITPIWSSGPAGKALVDQIDRQKRFQSLGHSLDLAQLWHLVAGASLLVSVDTSVAHMAKHTYTPTVALYGPSSDVLFGRGRFWSDAPFREVTVADFPCRDQRTLFKREVAWVRRCQRSSAECADPRCMHAIGIERVVAALGELGLDV
jgi:ADP-heptose:LPS heptosyltransferase